MEAGQERLRFGRPWTWPQVTFVLLWLALLIVGVQHFRKDFFDYHIYQEAGLKVLARHAESLYDRTQSQVVGYYYPYFWAFLFAGFLKISFGFDKFLFLLIFLGCYVKLLRFSVNHALNILGLERKHFYVVASWVIFLNFYAFNDSLINSNVAVVLAFFSVLAYEQHERRPWLAGLWLAVGGAIKLYPLFLIGYFVWKRSYQVAVWTVVFFLLFYYGIPVLVEGPVVGRQMIDDNVYLMSRYTQQIGWSYSAIMFQNFFGMGLRYLSLVGIAETRAFRPLVALGYGGILAMYAPSFLRPVRDPKFAAKVLIHSMALLPLVTPISWYNMGVFYAPMIAYLISRAVLQKDVLAKRALIIFFVLYGLTAQDIVSRRVNDVLEFYSVPFWGIAVLLFVFSRELFREYQAQRALEKSVDQNKGR